MSKVHILLIGWKLFNVFIDLKIIILLSTWYIIVNITNIKQLYYSKQCILKDGPNLIGGSDPSAPLCLSLAAVLTMTRLALPAWLTTLTSVQSGFRLSEQVTNWLSETLKDWGSVFLLLQSGFNSGSFLLVNISRAARELTCFRLFSLLLS